MYKCDLICYAQIRTKIRSSTREENHELKVGVPTRKENQDKQRKGLKTSCLERNKSRRKKIGRMIDHNMDMYYHSYSIKERNSFEFSFRA
ncbi:hypothetical protein MTR67_043645 [Solanum verrucosum]|uniref:Uncharacterized protein n=1 Tax=Solanum verrucosum TaxID=315347 RepID=A0AAF0UPG2_SOLVR|nr:hypothetical protein MTR67_043645 [Solanum verrucosum]